jgi:DNA primase
VYPQSDRWQCYRCDIGGDVIDFVRRRENLGFVEACRWLEGLPAQANVRRAVPRPRPERRWDRLTLEQQVIMNTACSLYQRTLWQEPRALAYLRERGLPDRVIHECAVGYCDGQQLSACLRRRWGLSVAQELGLLRMPGYVANGNTTDDLLGGRIVVPELRGGQCIWFIGRIVPDDGQRPKYLALPGERPILGWERAIGRREVFLVEGVIDYLTAVAWHLPAFSPCGTHLPAERLGFLARARTVYGVFDGDQAGQEAAACFARVLGRRFRPLLLPDGCDLNDLAGRPDGRTSFFRLLANARETARPEDGHGT